VGRSCIIAEIGGRRIMLDCGIHMVSAQQYPDFKAFTANARSSKQEMSDNFTDVFDCVLISHFHLDHCGALPYFTEIVGYNGPIIATTPTKAIIPLMLEDFRKIAQNKEKNN
jgi:integrator complex subunit 11